MKPLTQRALLATAVWAAVSAQTASAQLEEVLVTAERREANLQDTPISITTLSDQEIIDRGINSADDLITQVAGVYGYTPPGSAGSPAPPCSRSWKPERKSSTWSSGSASRSTPTMRSSTRTSCWRRTA